MTLLLIVTLLVIVLTPAVVAVYRVHTRHGRLPTIPFGVDYTADRMSTAGIGPDAERIRAELLMLNLHRRHSA